MSTLFDELQKQMKNGYERSDRETGFISRNDLSQIFTHSKLKYNLKNDYEKSQVIRKPRHSDLEQMISYVRDDAPKLYALLVLLKTSEKIIPLFGHKPRVTDALFDTFDDEGFGPCCDKRSLKSIPHLRDVADSLCDVQWYIPPVLDSKIHGKFPVSHFRFPFISKPEPLPKEKQGSWGIVSKVEVAREHLKSDCATPVSRPKSAKVMRSANVSLLGQGFVLQDGQKDG
jgi:hypothetical protein